MTESLADQGLDSDRDVKVLMGKVERLLSQLVREGEAALERTIPLDLLRSLLYYVARSGSDTPRVRDVKETYHLEELLPGSDVQADFEGPNRGLLEVVGEGIRDDLASIRDAVEIYVHSDERRPDVLEGLPERLGKVADTFSMLGLVEDHDTLQREADALAEVDRLEAGDAERRMQQLADVLLRVDSDLSDLQSGRPRAGGDDSGLAIRALPDSEYRPLLSAIVQAALEDLSKVREAVGVYCSDPDADIEAVAEVPALLTEIEGAARMLPLGHVQPLVRDLRAYVEREFVRGGQQPSDDAQILIADVVAGVEYYLEAVDHDRAGMTHLLESATRAMAALDSGAPPITHAEDEQVVIGSGDGPVEDLAASAPADAVAGGDDAAEPAAPGPGVAADDADAAAGGVDFDLGEPAADAAPGVGPDEPGAASASAPGEPAEIDFDLGAPAPAQAPEASPWEETEASPWEETEASPWRSPRSRTGAPRGGRARARPRRARAGGRRRRECRAQGAPAGGPGAEAEAGAGAGADEAIDEGIELEAGAAEPGDGGGEPESGLEAPGGPEAEPAAVPHPETGPRAAPPVEETPDDAGAAPGARAGVDPAASGSQYAIVGDDVDDEIVDVFIEEALGELDKINEHLPTWKANPEDQDALVVIRRAFHTLKGGGRLVGAELIGEFSWSMENMLNRVIDRSISASQPVFDTLDESSARCRS
ncbi:MAG: Hpt domain-containing protein [Halofilum sp. (in: g-proteobacteria)]|nr:Hpt domain-containing protein [Halofilum sp. (in: g-proteobacteria)]